MKAVQATQAPNRARAAGLDAARFVLIVLVVAGHLIEQLPHAPHLAVLYRFIYLFHMPAFVFLSGMVASDELDRWRARRLLFGIGGVYLLHQTLARALEAWLSGKAFAYQPELPYWALWYLMSLMWWRLSLPLLATLRQPLLWAIGLALLAGVWPAAGYGWSLSRTLAFLPFFVAGHLWARGQGMRLPSISWPVAAMMLGVLLVVAWLTRGFHLQWYYNGAGYATLWPDPWHGFAWRAVYLAVAGLGVAAVLALCARTEGRWVVLGQYSMAAYLLHMYLVKYAAYAGWFKPLGILPVGLRFAVLLVLSAAIAACFCLVGRRVPWLFDLDWLYRWLGRQSEGGQVPTGGWRQHAPAGTGPADPVPRGGT